MQNSIVISDWHFDISLNQNAKDRYVQNRTCKQITTHSNNIKTINHQYIPREEYNVKQIVNDTQKNSGTQITHTPFRIESRKPKQNNNTISTLVNNKRITIRNLYPKTTLHVLTCMIPEAQPNCRTIKLYHLIHNYSKSSLKTKP